MTHEYRSCVIAVFQNDEGKFLVAERTDIIGAWQLPQGGIDPGESSLKALYREMKEELGCDRFKVVREGNRTVSYNFPEDVKTGAAKKYSGQNLTWYLVKFDDGFGPNLKESDGELRAVKWVDLANMLAGIVQWKREAYESGLKMLKLHENSGL